jgi:hypothetical protein
MRLKDGTFTTYGEGLPPAALRPVQSIQVDRWSSPRTVYVALAPTLGPGGAVVTPGAVAVYDGP